MHKILLVSLLVFLSSYAKALPQEISFAEAKRTHTAGSGLFIDARGAKFYKRGTILGALNMPITRFGRMKRLLPGKKGSKLVVFCNGIRCEKSTKLAQKIAALGYSRVMVYRGGFPEWREKGQEIMLSAVYCQASEVHKKEVMIQDVRVILGRDEGMIDPTWFAAHHQKGTLPKQLTLIDVRSKKAFEEGHLPGAIHIPWNSDKGTIDSTLLPKDTLSLFYCNSGILSSDAYDSLNEETAKRVLFLPAVVKCKDEKCRVTSAQ